MKWSRFAFELFNDDITTQKTFTWTFITLETANLAEALVSYLIARFSKEIIMAYIKV
jgi:hypothetical protein